jgi:hypothetical protein
VTTQHNPNIYSLVSDLRIVLFSKRVLWVGTVGGRF